jgi:branched-chain amino acid transport system substrate-binding protein
MRFFATLACGALAACSFFVDASDTQCKSDGDCTARGGDFVGSTCGPGGVCTKSGPSCTTNQDCINSLNAPAICRHPTNVCAALGSPDCNKVLGDPSNDDAVVIGSLFSLSGNNESSGTARAHSVEVAFNDIKQNVPGIPNAPDGKVRTLVVVECDAANDVARAARHLVQDVGVPAIVGPEASGDVITVSAISIPGGTLLISPSATSTAITDIQDNDLVWRTAPSDSLQAIALLDQIPAIEAQYRSDNSIATGAKVKMAMLYLNDAYGLGLYDAVSISATLNGKPLGDASNGGLVLAQQYAAKPTDLSAQVNAVLAMNPRPGIVVALGSTEVVTLFVTPLEQQWGATAPRPLYLFADAAHKPELLTLAADDTIRKRVRGSIPASPSTPAYTTFVSDYQSVFPGAPFPQVFGMAGAYDATFLITYGVATTPGKPITGTSIETGFARLVSGAKLDVRGQNVGKALQILGSGGSFDVEGASGPLDFDLKTGDVRGANIDVWCVAKDGNGAPIFVSSGRYYDATTSAMAGVFSSTTCQAN